MTTAKDESPNDAPFTEMSLAQLALAATAQDLSDLARSFTTVHLHRHMRGSLLEDAARVMSLAQEFIERVVIAEKAAGTSWEDIGDTLNITKQSSHARYRDAVATWEAALSDPETPDQMHSIDGLRAYLRNNMPRGTANPEETAADLDAWVTAHAVADGRDVDPNPVSGLLERMDPMWEIMHLGSALTRLTRQYMNPPPDLRAALYAREAVLYERLAAKERGSARRTALDSAAKAHAIAAREREEDRLMKEAAETLTAEDHSARHGDRLGSYFEGPLLSYPSPPEGRPNLWCPHCRVWVDGEDRMLAVKEIHA